MPIITNYSTVIQYDYHLLTFCICVSTAVIYEILITQAVQVYSNTECKVILTLGVSFSAGCGKDRIAVLQHHEQNNTQNASRGLFV